ncbi:MAG: esterase family protein [Treponema sp.]|nr:esterase family protein [Treponema sp.]
MILRGSYSSEVMHTSVNIQVYISNPGAEPPYKIIYLLHGLHGNQESWIDNSMLMHYGKEYNAVFVMPDVSRSFYCNLKYGRQYYSFVADELPAISRKIFNISSRREDTAVIGYSMGGYGALRLALSRPEQYSFCGAISPACLYFKSILDKLRTDAAAYMKTSAEAKEIVTDLYSIYGEPLEYNPEYDVLYLAKNFPSNMPKPKIYTVCGTEDDLVKENHQFRDELKDANLDFTYEEWSGGHDWYFFNEGLKKTLEVWHNSPG